MIELNESGLAQPNLHQLHCMEGVNEHPTEVRVDSLYRKDARLFFPIKEVVHPTDFSALSKKAFVHALRIALNAQCKLSIIHVAESDSIDEEIAYAFLSRVLSQWQRAEKRDSRSISFTVFGNQIEHIALRGKEFIGTLAEYVHRREPELIVLSTHGRTGLDHLLKGSIAETLFSRTSASTLFISPHTRGFVDPVTGEARLGRVLLPVDHSPAPDRAIHTAREFGRIIIGHEPKLDFVHVGSTAPEIVDERAIRPRVILRPGYDAATGIIEAATELTPDMICMATAGRHGLLDALRGSTTERVLRAAPCPVLATVAL